MSAPSPYPYPPFLPTVSVVVTAFRREAYLPAALRSIAASAGDVRPETVLVKDAPTPALDRHVEREMGGQVLNDPTLLEQGEMFAAGIEAARGDLVLFCEDDDEVSPVRVASVAHRFARDPALVLVRNGFDPLAPDGSPHPLPALIPQPAHAARIDASEPDAVRRWLPWLLKHRAYGNVSTLAVRRDAALRHIERIRRIEALGDGAIPTFLLDEGPHLIDPTRLTRRRLGTSIRPLGLHGDAARGVRTFARVARSARTPLARAFALATLRWAEVDLALRSRDATGMLPARRTLLPFLRDHLPRLDPNVSEMAAFALFAKLAPRAGPRAYGARAARWASRRVQSEAAGGRGA